MVPKGWSQSSVHDVLRRVSRPVTVNPDEHYREIGIRSHGKGIFDKPPVRGKDLGDKRVFWVEPNCFVANIVFAWEQAIARTYEHDRGKIASHRFPMYAPRDSKVDIDYITHFFRTPKGKHLLGLASPGGAGRNKTLGQKEFERLPLLLPPMQEQQRIAQVLRTWEKSIEVLERLLDNSESQKTALMQKLLRPTTSRKSRDIPLSEVADVLVSNVDKKTRPGEIPVKLCNYTDVYYNDYITSDLDFMSATATPSQVERFSLKKGDIVITKDSEAPDDIAVPALVSENLSSVVCGYHLAIVRPKDDDLDGDYLRALFSLKATQHYFFVRANGVTRFGLPVSVIEDAVFALPPLSEQRSIAQVIRASEGIVRAEKRQLTALRAQKSALLQQLLTGKRRVHLHDNSEQAACA